MRASRMIAGQNKKITLDALIQGDYNPKWWHLRIAAQKARSTTLNNRLDIRLLISRSFLDNGETHQISVHALAQTTLGHTKRALITCNMGNTRA